MTKVEAMRAYLDMLSERTKLDGELRAAKRETARVWTAFGGNHVDCGCGVKCAMSSCPLLKKARKP